MITTENIAWGKFKVSSLAHTVTATFIRGRSKTRGEKSFWVLNTKYASEQKKVIGNKEDALKKATEMMTKPLRTPLTAKQEEAMLRKDGLLHGIVELPFDSIFSESRETLQAKLMTRLVQMPADRFEDIRITPIVVGEKAHIRFFVEAALRS